MDTEIQFCEIELSSLSVFGSYDDIPNSMQVARTLESQDLDDMRLKERSDTVAVPS
jgi:hypothetical protein